VRFYVGFVDEVNAVFVTQLLPPFRLGIMARAHGIDVVLLHQEDILHHQLFGHYVARFRIVLLHVHPLEGYGHPVDQEKSPFDFHTPEADFCGDGFQEGPVCIAQGEGQLVKVGKFGTPGFDPGEWHMVLQNLVKIDFRFSKVGHLNHFPHS